MLPKDYTGGKFYTNKFLLSLLTKKIDCTYTNKNNNNFTKGQIIEDVFSITKSMLPQNLTISNNFLNRECLTRRPMSLIL